jgi:glyoxylase-like metal-dependent hydrolase (beta-lactamase superfamily II)
MSADRVTFAPTIAHQIALQVSVSHSTGETGVMQIGIKPEEPPAATGPDVHLVRANNPSLLTLTGTNTWVLTSGGGSSGGSIVIDPGPPLPEHLAAIRALGRPAAIVLTHQHADHAEAAPALAAEFDIPVYAAHPDLTHRTTPLTDGDEIVAADRQLTVMATPGHTSDSVCLASDEGIFTGDTLLGGSTTIIAPPSGSLVDYFASMNRLGALVGRAGFPGHGPAFASVGAWATRNAEHRQARLTQLAVVYATLAVAGTPSLTDVASATYGENGNPVAPYIEMMTAAQLTFLSERGDIPKWK